MDENADAVEEGGNTVAGCLRIRDSADIDIYVLPDTARCKCTGVSPLDMDACPLRQFDNLGMECWPGDCDEYTEDEEDEPWKNW